ncbi:hypothetical protein BAUCODRAFT_38181 [Baudoinia panamericana UAMH 10762]|uniref:Uncharacterized protein n=1 Tax=Baudoinia panamericana (strain UAMH 10762) TaxID=717646 RepID=M2N0K6_BAUPA|nr:uncharacterized protein BAUCODRAFT_38181 [Baudoinia panamericana UAMH 10762]EMC92155.1 hypothetical protein BAUCODRAFT_38181 [Baudoinia panamericana UAMH 10762]
MGARMPTLSSLRIRRQSLGSQEITQTPLHWWFVRRNHFLSRITPRDSSVSFSSRHKCISTYLQARGYACDAVTHAVVLPLCADGS